MRNLWLVLIPSIFIYLCLIGPLVYHIVKKPKYYLPKAIFFACALIFLIATDVPCYKDLCENETRTVEAEYVKFQTGSPVPYTRKAFFEGEDGRIYVYVPTLTRDVAKMEMGKTYEVEYFCNSRVIKEYRLVE